MVIANPGSFGNLDFADSTPPGNFRQFPDPLKQGVIQTFHERVGQPTCGESARLRDNAAWNIPNSQKSTKFDTFDILIEGVQGSFTEYSERSSLPQMIHAMWICFYFEVRVHGAAKACWILLNLTSHDSTQHVGLECQNRPKSHQMAIPSRRWDVSTRKSRCEEKKVRVQPRRALFSRVRGRVARVE